MARVNGGYIPHDHWVQQNSSGAGRIIGEFCHFVDWARCVIGVPIVSVTANALPDGARYNRDNVVATFTFLDGSIASVSYLANGDRSIPKEQFEVFCESKVGRITTFAPLSWLATERPGASRRGRTRGMHAKSI